MGCSRKGVKSGTSPFFGLLRGGTWACDLDQTLHERTTPIYFLVDMSSRCQQFASCSAFELGGQFGRRHCRRRYGRRSALKGCLGRWKFVGYSCASRKRG